MIALDAGSLSKPSSIRVLPRICFSKIDQAFLVWGGLTLLIFSFAQFSTLSWVSQSVIDAVLTAVGIVATSGLTWAIATQANLRWVIFLWAVLMTAGTVVTVCGIFCGSVLVLANLCLLWLGLCAVGYGSMAVGMRSRSFTLCFLVHIGAIVLLNFAPGWQFFNSGLVMALPLFFFSFIPWDMQN